MCMRVCALLLNVLMRWAEGGRRERRAAGTERSAEDAHSSLSHSHGSAPDTMLSASSVGWR